MAYRGSRAAGRRNTALPAALLAALLALPGAWGGVAETTPASPACLLKDVVPQTYVPGIGISAIGEMGGEVYVSMREGVSRDSLWKTDGTAGGTVLLRAFGGEATGPFAFTKLAGTMFFSADDGGYGREIWRSNGTPEGTILLKDIRPGAGGSIPTVLGVSPFTYAPPEQPPILVVGTTLYFFADDGTTGLELWKSDGSPGGTVLVKDIQEGLAPSVAVTDGRNAWMTALDGEIYFVADDGIHGKELWKSDGTAAGTVLVKDLNADAANAAPANLAVSGGVLYFSADDGNAGRELWRTDGTDAGTTLVRDIRPGSGSSNPASLRDVAGTLFFAAAGESEPSEEDPGGNPLGSELWKSDGSETGTVMVRDIYEGAGSSSPTLLAVDGGKMLLSARTAAEGFEPWISDGTSAGTFLLKDVNPGTGHSTPQAGTVLGGAFYFTATDPATGKEIWKSDGTAEGTALLADFNPGSTTSSPNALTSLLGSLWFRAYEPTTGAQLRKSDGTAGGTSLVLQVAGEGANGSNPACFEAVRGSALFFAADPVAYVELFRTDGTAEGTGLMHEFCPGPLGCSPGVRTVLRGKAYFRVSDVGVFESDGTEAGTVQLPDIDIPANPQPLTEVLGTLGGDLYLMYGDPATGGELWKRSAESPGRTLVKDIRPGTAGSLAYSESPCAALNGVLYFAADDGTSGKELWRTDGTEAGTVLVRDIRAGAVGSAPEGFVASGDAVYFAADDGIAGIELWRTDGTEAGTTLVRDLFPGPGDSRPGSLADLDGTLLFSALSATQGRELWKSDGTDAGTVVVTDLRPGTAGSAPRDVEVLRGSGLAVFGAEDGAHGRELWITDGTSAGTRLLQDLVPGTGSSGPTGMRMSGGRVFFSAEDGTVGYEPWCVTYEDLGISRSTLDTDGDGFGDEIEAAVGSSPWDDREIPSGAAPAPAQALAPGKTAVALRFDRTGKDSITVRGLLPVAEGFEPEGSVVVVEAGGVVRSFTLDGKGRAKGEAGDSFKIKLRVRSGVADASEGAAFTAKLRLPEGSDVLRDERFLGDADVEAEPRALPVSVLFDGTQYRGSRALLYSVTAGKKGAAKD